MTNQELIKCMPVGLLRFIFNRWTLASAVISLVVGGMMHSIFDNLALAGFLEMLVAFCLLDRAFDVLQEEEFHKLMSKTKSPKNQGRVI